ECPQIGFKGDRHGQPDAGEHYQQHTRSSIRDHGSQNSTDSRQRQALREQLPDQPHPPRSERQPQADLPPPRRGASQQQVGHVEPRNQQNQSHHRHQHQQRLRELPPDLPESLFAGFRLERGLRDVSPPPFRDLRSLLVRQNLAPQHH